MINAYDFDKTIYDGDSTIDFYVYCLKRNKSIILYLPIQFFGFILYKLHIKEKEYFKEKFFVFLNKIDDIDQCVINFWNENEYKIKKWYLNQKEENDLIISASPYFLLLNIAERLSVKNLIATDVDKKTGKFLSKNCYGEEKVIRFKKEYNNKKIENFYSDSLSDMPMMNLSINSFLVKGDNFKKIK